MKYNEIYIRILAYISIIIITSQSIFNIVIIQSKNGFDYFLHMAVEICYWYMSISFLYMIRVWKYPEIKQELKYLNIKKDQYPTIDILVPCYNEDEDLIKNTLQEAQKIDYPKELYNIYLLDDSKRIKLKNICEELNISYITRQNNKFQKSGNLNEFLKSQYIQSVMQNNIISPESKKSTNLTNEEISFREKVELSPSFNSNLKKSISLENSFKSQLMDNSVRIIDIETGENTIIPSTNNSPFKLNINPLSPEFLKSRSNSISNNNSESKLSDFICVFDCDMIPKSNIFQILIPYLFENNKDIIKDDDSEFILDKTIAFVQPRQYFYNCHYDSDYNDMDNCVYVKLTMPAMNEMKSAPYIGTNALISRESLNSVDLFFEGHATEDTITSLIICSTIVNNGSFKNQTYRSKYVYPQKVAEGFAPETMAEAFDQRLRWVKGSVQLIMNKNPILRKNFSFEQKIAWFTTNAYWIFGIFFFGQYVSHIYIYISHIMDDVKTPINDLITYQFSFMTQIVSFILLPEITIVEKIRSIQMFTCYIPVYIFAFLSHIFGCLSISKVSNKGKQRKFHILFLFHIFVLLSIYILSIYILITKKLNNWELAKVISLMIIYVVLFMPIIRTFLKCKNKNNGNICFHTETYVF
jgi:cellulose synthase/poly-beta-1,6-N-acetylglucosamine synthase-like glycosyltransferase